MLLMVCIHSCNPLPARRKYGLNEGAGASSKDLFDVSLPAAVNDSGFDGVADKAKVSAEFITGFR